MNSLARFRLYVSTIVLIFISHPLFAQEANNTFVYQYGPNGQSLQLIANADDDGDGIDNALELNGYTYDPIGGLQPWSGDSTVTYYITDPRRWSTDGDPYSDFMEVSGVNMPGGVSQPYAHPLVAARPIISMYMFDYDVIPISDITNSEGGASVSTYTNSTTNENQLGGSVSTEFSFSPFKLGKVAVEVNYSHTWSRTQTTTNTSEINWEKAVSTNSSEAARLKLRVYMENLGSASATDVVPTFNLQLGRKIIATITSPEQANILSTAGTANSRYPATEGIVIDKTSNGDDIILSIDELRAIERGAPLSLVVTQVSANVIRWNPSEEQFSSTISWNAFENEIDPVTMTVQADIGNGERANYQVFAGTQFFDPEFTLLDVFKTIFEVEGTGDNTVIEGRPYPLLWYLNTDSDVLIDAWEAQGEPENMLGLPAEENTFLSMVSPPLDPDPQVNLASFSPDLRNIIVSAVPSGGFPIISVQANIQINGQDESIDLIQPDGFPFFVNESTFAGPAGAEGTVLVTDASGESVEHPIALPFTPYQDCADVAGGSSNLPNPGGEYTLFAEGDLGRPAQAYCTFYDDNIRLLDPLTNFWLDRSIADNQNINFSQVFMLDPTTAVAVGRIGNSAEGVVYRTEDTGTSWIELRSSGGVTATFLGYLLGVDFLPDGMTGIAVGASGEIILTSNGGKTWSKRSSGSFTNHDLNSVFYISPDTVLTVGGDAVYLSYDGGETWPGKTTLEAGLNRPFKAVYNKDTSTIIVYAGADIFRSVDKGESFEPLTGLSFGELTHVSEDSWFGKSDVRNYHSYDDGATWSESEDRDGDYFSLNVIHFISDMVGVATGDHSSFYKYALFRTEDGGFTWEFSELANISRNAGPIRSIAMYDQNVGMAVGANGSILYTASSGGMPVIVSGTDYDDAVIQSETITLDQNYPNPFSSTTTIAFELPSPDEVSLVVYDMLGREVAKVVDGVSLQNGKHAYTIDASRLAPGAYFYRLETGEVTQTHQMIIVR